MGWGLCSWTLFICEKGNDPKWGLLRFSANITVLFSWNFYFFVLFCFALIKPWFIHYPVLFCLGRGMVEIWILLWKTCSSVSWGQRKEKLNIDFEQNCTHVITVQNVDLNWALFTSVGDPFKFVLVLCFQGLNGCIIHSWQKGSEINRDWKLVHLMSTWKNTDCIFSVVWKGN